MPANYSPTTTAHATITCPIDSDPPNASATTTPLEELADNHERLKQGVDAQTFQQGITSNSGTNPVPAVRAIGNAARSALRLDPQAQPSGASDAEGDIFVSNAGTKLLRVFLNAAWHTIGLLDRAQTWVEQTFTAGTAGAAGVTATGNTTGAGGVFTGGGGNANGVTATGTSVGNGVEGQGGATSGNGVKGTGGPSTPGVLGIGGTGNASGVLGQGKGGSAGVKGEGDPTGGSDGMGVWGVATGNADGVRGNGHGTGAGVHGIGGATGPGGLFVGGGNGAGVTASASGSGAAVDATQTGSGAAVNADASGGTGAGVVAKGNNTRAPLSIPINANFPSSPATGDFYVDSSSPGTARLWFYDGHTTTGGGIPFGWVQLA